MSACDLYQIDALELLGSLADGVVDAVISDPPFDQRTSDGARTNTESRAGFGNEAFIDFDGLTPAQLRCFVREALRVSRGWVLAFCSLEQLGWYQQAAEDSLPGSWIRAGVWVKPDSAPQFTGDRPAQGAEGLAIMHRPGRKAWNGGGTRAVWEFGVLGGQR